MNSRLPREEFEQLVSEALDDLPASLASYMDNVEVAVEDLPRPETAQETAADSASLLGLYQGIPLTERHSGYFGVLPDRITLYQRNLERAARSREDLRELVRSTVIHEVAHHFGIDDDRLDELGWS